MKKLVLFAVAALSMSFFACGSGEKAECADSCCDSAAAAVEAVDTVAADTVAAADTIAADSAVVAE